MSPPSSWFTEGHMCQAIQVGNVISLSHPKPSKWRILEVLREHDYQKYETAKDPSYASVQLSSEALEDFQHAHTPPLLGYLEDQQDRFGPVPGGFITYYAWEAMPGIRLGDYTGKATRFWTLDKKEREEIRVAFRQIYLEITSMGIWPDSAAATNLVWNSETKSLTWVGFWNCRAAQPQPWKDWRLALFDFVKSPDNSWTDPDWNGDTSKWEY
ncbi:uncharacterized protein N7458_006170 [Penicillium daleae]|uniref:Uncharacterized protein n=1 Tax=Penicillium daleae TaxID=63821 RepID=A0AAD6C5L8_9EURO|nr:uncharacterized protein N7458_006170 [Penicillium daleae]KAJ5449721.1 hypothetical protein N7458_006170 [Penicillium daleae]